MTPRWLDCLDPIASHLAASYPNEGCGLILETDQGFGFLPVPNLAPSAVASHTFELDPTALLQADSRGERVSVIVHSHVDVDADFSGADVRAALAPGAPARPWYPDVDHLVVAVVDGVARTAALSRFAPPGAFPRIWSHAFRPLRM